MGIFLFLLPRKIKKRTSKNSLLASVNSLISTIFILLMQWGAYSERFFGYDLFTRKLTELRWEWTYALTLHQELGTTPSWSFFTWIKYSILPIVVYSKLNTPSIVQIDGFSACQIKRKSSCHRVLLQKNVSNAPTSSFLSTSSIWWWSSVISG